MELEITFNKLPKVLIIRLKAFNSETVEFQMKLNFKKSFRKEYSLISIANHYGDCNGGHCKIVFFIKN